MRRAAAIALVAPLLGAGAAATAAAPAGAGPAPARLLVTATEFRLALSRPSLPAGRAIVQLSDRGEDPHDLVARRVDRRGRAAGARQAVPLAPPGGVTTGRMTLRPGRYVLYCTLAGHRARGMQARLRVR